MITLGALSGLVACEGLIGASFDRSLRPENADASDDADTPTDEAGVRDGASDARPGDAKKPADAAPATPPSCGDTSGLDTNAAWPMAGYCPTRPNRSLAPSMVSPAVRRRFTLAPTSGGATFTYFASGAAIDDAGVAYALVTEIADASLHIYAVAIDGTTEAWRTDVTPGLAYVSPDGMPVLAANGNVYAAVGSTLVAMSRAGKVAWSRGLGSTVGAPLVLGDGTVVMTVGATVRALTPSGDDAWTFSIDGSSGYFFRGVTATPSGALLVVQDVGGDAMLWSFNPGGSVNWSRPLTSQGSSVVVVDDQSQAIARTRSTLAVFGAGGATLLTKATATGGHATNVLPALLPSGNAWFGDGFDLLFYDAASGGTSVTTRSGRHSSVVGTSDGDAVFAEAVTPDAHVVSIGPDGQERWSVPIDLSGADLQPPSLDKDGSVYVPFGQTLYVVGP